MPHPPAQEFFERCIDFVRTKMAAEGSVENMFLADCEDGSSFLVPTPWANESEREQMLRVLELVFAIKGVYRYAQISEVWSVSQPLDESRSRVMPMDDPRRVERVMTLLVTRDKPRLWSADIVRNPDGSFRELSSDDDRVPTDLKGRMLELLPPLDFTPPSKEEAERLMAALGPIIQEFQPA